MGPLRILGVLRTPDDVQEWLGRNRSGRKKERKPKLFGPDIFQWGRGLPRERVGAKKFDTSLETREIKLLGRDIPGFCRDIPEVPEKFENKKKFVFNFRSLIEEAGRQGMGKRRPRDRDISRLSCESHRERPRGRAGETDRHILTERKSAKRKRFRREANSQSQKSHEQHQRFFECITQQDKGLEENHAPESSPESLAKSLSHTFFVVHFLSRRVDKEWA